MAFPPPRSVTAEEFGKDEYLNLLSYVVEMVKHLKAKTRGIREELMPKWVRIYRGVPAEEERSWPWPGASNLIVQLAATHADELLARVMALFQNDPIFAAQILADFDDDSDASGNQQKDILEQFLDDCAIEPEELDLFRVEETVFSSAIRYGTGIVTLPWEYIVEQQSTYIGGGTEVGTKASYKFEDVTKRDGPHPEPVPLADWLIDPKWPNLNQADAFGRTLHLNRYQLKDRQRFPEIFDKEIIDIILQNPDRESEYSRQLEEQKKTDTRPGPIADNFDLEELHFVYNKDGKKFRLIAFHHAQTEKTAGIIYNPYPENIEPYEDAKLAYDDDTYFGYGYCEMLESYQREVSTTHNWRTDNRHFATTGVGRVNKNSKLASIIQLYPGVFIPADKDEVEPLQFGAGALQYGTEDEQLTLQLATMRAGVDPAVGGQGAGIVNKKGQFSAQGTAITLQAQNNRNSLRMSDMRQMHVRLGRKLLMLYSHFGIINKIRKYGNRAELLTKALDSYKKKTLGLSIKGATASFNVELEKQNDILLSASLERLWAADLQAMQQVAMPQLPPEMKELIIAQMRARNSLSKSLLRAFGKRDDDRLIPVPASLKGAHQNAITNGQQQQNGGQGTPAQVVQQPSQTQGMVPIGNGSISGVVPSGATQ